MTVAVINVKVLPAEVLEIRASGDAIATTLRTPGHDRELALGRLFAMRIIETARDVATITHCGRVGDDSRRNTIDVRAAPGFAFDLERVEPDDPTPPATRADHQHRAAILDADGQVIAAHEDVDPLNAIDKAVGAWLLAVELSALHTMPSVLVISGPANPAIEQRAARAGIVQVCSTSGPLDLDR
jgi:FdhD protein